MSTWDDSTLGAATAPDEVGSETTVATRAGRLVAESRSYDSKSPRTATLELKPA